MKHLAHLVLASMLLLSILLSACKSTETPTPKATTTAPSSTSAPAATTTVPKTSTPATTAPSGKPQYGGTLNLIATTNYTVFGPAVQNRPGGAPGMWDQLTTSDRTKSVAGGGKLDYGDGPTSMSDLTGALAQKWSTPDPFTWIVDIRQGVHFSKIPNNVGSDLVNGREMTADDVVASIEFLRDTPSSWASVSEPIMEKNMTVEKTGPWQVTVHTPQNPNTTYLWIMGGGGSQYVWPKEWLPKYGTNNDWKVQVGTGPFMITDFVDGSALTMTRNPNYWEKNPVGPGKGDQLPYVDGMKIVIVPDVSTQLTALRTGKADAYITGNASLSREDWAGMQKTNPQMKNYRFLSLPLQIGFRRDKQDLPFKDIKVRQALMMATDLVGIKKDQYGGEAELIDSPARILYPSVFTPLDKLPADTQALYTYNPTKAKQLLADAGYASGFKTSLTIDSSAAAADMAQIIKAQWLKVGVDVTVQIQDNAQFQKLWSVRSFDQMMMTANAGGNAALFVRYSYGYFRGANSYNISYVNDPEGSDPIIQKAITDTIKVLNIDFAACDKIMKDVNVYILGQAFLIPTPAPYVNRVWQPWVKDYYGESAAKLWIQYLWIDQAQKKSMGF